MYGNSAKDATASDSGTVAAADEDVSDDSPGPDWSETRGERSLL